MPLTRLAVAHPLPSQPPWQESNYPAIAQARSQPARPHLKGFWEIEFVVCISLCSHHATPLSALSTTDRKSLIRRPDPSIEITHSSHFRLSLECRHSVGQNLYGRGTKEKDSAHPLLFYGPPAEFLRFGCPARPIGNQKFNNHKRRTERPSPLRIWCLRVCSKPPGKCRVLLGGWWYYCWAIFEKSILLLACWKPSFKKGQIKCLPN